MSRDRGWDDRAEARPRADLGPSGHRYPGESNVDALARLAGERDAALQDLERERTRSRRLARELVEAGSGAEVSRNACADCGHDPACGHATVTRDGVQVRLCHDDDHSCYSGATQIPR